MPPRAKKTAAATNADVDADVKKPARKRAAAPKKLADESESDDEEPKKTVKKAIRKTAAKSGDKAKKTTKKPTKKSEDDKSEDGSDDDQPKKSTAKRAARKGKRKTASEDKSDDESDEDQPKKSTVKRVARKGKGKTASEDKSDDESDEDQPKKSTVKRAARKGKDKTVSEDDKSDDESDDDRPKKSTVKRVARKGKGKTAGEPKAKQKKSNGKVESEDDEKPKEKTVIIKGQAAVDPECEAKVDCAHVYCGDGNIYDAMLNQTNLSDNNNKYYIMQILEDDDAKVYSVWFRWGRVGKKGQSSLSICGSNLDQAKSIFTKKFSEKTRNKWEFRENFVKVAGKYDLLKMDYSTEDVKEDKTKPEKKKVETKSLLEPNLQKLMELIFNIQAMERTVVEMKYDANKSPLGKLTTEQIKAGFTALKKIEDCVTKEDFGSKLVAACDEFYTRIPHDFGMKRPPVIRTLQEVHAKVELLETLGDIEIAMKLLREELKTDEHPIDRNYKSLKCNLKSVDKSHPDYQMIEQYLQNTHGDTHNQYKLELVNLFECGRDTEKDNYQDVGNRMLLWHGSRLANFAGILKQGLRIAPPEAPVTGYMFDKGVYFADMSSKSANYCFTSRTNPLGLLLLCEVSLGTPNKLLNSDCNASKLPKGHHSVMGLGQVAPSPNDYKTLSDGTVVPFGKGTDTGVKNPNGYTLQYNEYIVYDTKQICLRYLLQTKFKY